MATLVSCLYGVRGGLIDTQPRKCSNGSVVQRCGGLKVNVALWVLWANAELYAERTKHN